MMLGNILLNVAAAFELFLLGKIGIETLAAYSIAMSSVWALFNSVHGGLINAAMAVVSRRYGAKQHDEISSALPGMLFIGVIFFSTFALVCYAVMVPAFVFFGAKGAVLKQVTGYMSAVLILSFIMPFYSQLLGVSRGIGDSTTPLKIISVIVPLNIILNAVFIGRMNAGIIGAAYSAIATYFTGAALYTIIFIRGNGGVKLRLGPFKSRLFFPYAGLAVKSVLQNFTGDAGTMIMLRIIAPFGDAFIAAYGIVSRLINFLMMAGWPICNSGGVIVGHNLGAGFRKRAIETVLESTKVFLWITVPTAVIFFFYAAAVMRAFTTDAAVVEFGRQYLVIIAPSLLFMAVGQACQSGFSGAGFIGTPTIVNVAAFIILRPLLAVAFDKIPGIGSAGVFWAISAAYLVYGIVYWFIYKDGRWANKEI
jgi:putative MATE family efflux protein